MGKFSTTWSLMGSSWQLLKKDKEILLFPLISGICCLIVLASFAIPMVVTSNALQPADGAARSDSHEMYYALLFLFYFFNYFVIVFFNTAIVACADIRMKGGDPTVADGLRAAFSRISLIIGWALVQSTVGLILRVLEDRSDKVGKFIVALLGMAWTVTSFLVIPILVIEKKGPIKALKESTSLLKNTWGEQVIGNFSFGLVFFALGIPALLFVVIGFLSGNGTGLIVSFVLAAIYLIVLALIQSALQAIFQTALYQYARNGQAPQGFDEASLANAVARK